MTGRPPCMIKLNNYREYLHHQLKLVLQTLILFSPVFYDCHLQTNDKIKHALYTSEVPFYVQKGPVWFFSGFEIHSRTKMTWSEVLQVLQTSGSTIEIRYSLPLTNLANQTEFSQLEKDCSSSSKDGHGL